jgi:hypothetical protein
MTDDQSPQTPTKAATYDRRDIQSNILSTSLFAPRPEFFKAVSYIRTCSSQYGKPKFRQVFACLFCNTRNCKGSAVLQAITDEDPDGAVAFNANNRKSPLVVQTPFLGLFITSSKSYPLPYIKALIH